MLTKTVSKSREFTYSTDREMVLKLLASHGMGVNSASRPSITTDIRLNDKADADFAGKPEADSIS